MQTKTRRLRQLHQILLKRGADSCQSCQRGANYPLAGGSGPLSARTEIRRINVQQPVPCPMPWVSAMNFLAFNRAGNTCMLPAFCQSSTFPRSCGLDGFELCSRLLSGWYQSSTSDQLLGVLQRDNARPAGFGPHYPLGI